MSTKSETSAGNRAGRDCRKEAQAAINFWQALEYLAPQSPPAVKLEDSVWAFASDAPERELPWNDPRKRAIVDRQIGPNRRFQLFAGILGGDYFVETARRYLGADDIDQSERRPASPTACVVLNVNSDGIASEEIFVSTVPWAMAQIASASGTEKAISFRGFFGQEGLGENIRSKILDLMVERKLLADESDPDEEDAAPAATDAADVPYVRPAQPVTRPVTSDDIAAITSLVFALCGWTPEQQEPWRVQAIWVPENDAGDGASRDDPLNSFYAEDLERVADALEAGSVGPGLQAYLQGEDSASRIDLEEQASHLIDGVHPARQTPGCWPAKFPLVTAQQFAVNTLMRELAETGGIFSVNGPPGTGKTTMLKDIIAAIVVSRADVLVQFGDPESAFTKRLAIENYQYPAYELDPRLRGFGIVVSSANNGAVENITKELPGLPAIAPDLNVDYFSMVADSVAAPPRAKQRAAVRERWGLVAAVLGNKGNRSTFANRFWLAGLQAKPKAGEKSAPPDPLRLRSLQDLVKTGEHGALPWDVARKRYRQARDKVDDLMDLAARVAGAIQLRGQASEARARALAALVDHATALDSGKEALHQARAHQGETQAAYERARQQFSVCRTWGETHARMTQQRDAHAAASEQVKAGALDDARAAHARAAAAHAGIRADLESHNRSRPAFLSELFRTQFSRRWNAHGAQLESQLREAREKEASAADRVGREESLERELDRRLEAFQIAEAQASACWSDVEAAGVPDACAGVAPVDGGIDAPEPGAILGQMDRIVARSSQDLQAAAGATTQAQLALDAIQQAIAAERAQLARAEADLAEVEHLLSDPRVPSGSLKNWDLAALDRDSMHRAAPYDFPALFEARRNLFIAAMALHQAFVVAAWKRLSRTLSAFVNLLQGNLAPSQINGGPVQLWDAFFLVVPVISTTFASFPRLFAGVGREELAWLMIDEAGQAAPQQAVGAIWRSRRTVIVGDPLQLEPVVGVPQEMMGPLLERCSAEQQWAPPVASAQTLADRANRYGMYLGEPDSDDRIWLGSPLLVHRRCLDPMFRIANGIAYDNKMVYGAGDDTGPHGIGQSTWVHVPAERSEGHWVEAQARRAMELVQAITGGVLQENGQFKVYVITPFRSVAQKIWNLLFQTYGAQSRGMAGTVHTFQGKEAEHVVFLLGGNPSSPGVISSFAGAKPNLVNVAVTRAKRRLYVVGDREFWTGASDVRQIYSQMAEHLDGMQQDAEAGPDQERPYAEAT
jgi:hypothetical protein